MLPKSQTETVCCVKPESPKGVGRFRRLFVELFTGRQPNVVEASAPRSGEFLRVEVGYGKLYPNTVALCVLFDGATTAYNTGKRRTRLLRNLRTKGTGVGYDHLLLCAACGCVQKLTSDQLMEARPERCGQCRASLSDVACPVHHAFGLCSECSSVKICEAPFDAPEPTSAQDPAMWPV